MHAVLSVLHQKKVIEHHEVEDIRHEGKLLCVITVSIAPDNILL